MTTLGNAKIKVDDNNRQEVKAALEALGYNFAGVPENATAYYLYEGCVDAFMTNPDSTPGHFERHENPEHFLHNGQFVTELPPQQPAKKLENIFIKLGGGTTKEVARKALEDAGYAVSDDFAENFEAALPLYVTGNDDGAIGYGTSLYAPNPANERCVWQGMLVGKAYFTTPKTPAEIDKKWFKDVETSMLTSDEYNSSVRPPLGLKPRKIHDQDRLIEVLQACLRYAEAGKQVPSDWWAEAQYLNSLVEGK